MSLCTPAGVSNRAKIALMLLNCLRPNILSKLDAPAGACLFSHHLQAFRCHCLYLPIRRAFDVRDGNMNFRCGNSISVTTGIVVDSRVQVIQTRYAINISQQSIDILTVLRPCQTRLQLRYDLRYLRIPLSHLVLHWH